MDRTIGQYRKTKTRNRGCGCDVGKESWENRERESKGQAEDFYWRCRASWCDLDSVEKPFFASQCSCLAPSQISCVGGGGCVCIECLVS